MKRRISQISCSLYLTPENGSKWKQNQIFSMNNLFSRQKHELEKRTGLLVGVTGVERRRAQAEGTGRRHLPGISKQERGALDHS